MTPEARAAKALHRAAEDSLTDGYTRADCARWHSLIAQAVMEAMKEARDVCQFMPDKIAIGELMVGGRPESSGPGPIECVVCEGVGRIGAVPCRACNGVGKMMDSGPMDPETRGLLGVKPCGCAADWIGSGAPDDYRIPRRKLGEDQGWVWVETDAATAMPRLTRGAGGCETCQPDRRAQPRQAVGAPDIADTPPGVTP